MATKSQKEAIHYFKNNFSYLFNMIDDNEDFDINYCAHFSYREQEFVFLFADSGTNYTIMVKNDSQFNYIEDFYTQFYQIRNSHINRDHQQHELLHANVTAMIEEFDNIKEGLRLYKIQQTELAYKKTLFPLVENYLLQIDVRRHSLEKLEKIKKILEE